MKTAVFYSYVCPCEEGVVVTFGNFLSIHVREFARYGVGVCMAGFAEAARVLLLVPELSHTLLEPPAVKMISVTCCGRLVL